MARKRTNREMETSKRIVLCTGIFAAIQIEETMALTVLFPHAASTLLTICLTCITGYVTVLSWYFGKALGENRLKITQGLGSFHGAVSGIASSHKKTKITVEEDDDEDDDEEDEDIEDEDDEDSVG